MLKRQMIISIVAGVLLLLISLILFNKANGDAGGKNKREVKGSAIKVETMKVTNADHHQNYAFSGRLLPKEFIDIYAEVGGNINFANKPFKEGFVFNKGEILLKVDASEYRSSIISKRSKFLSLITQTLPDIKLDFPETYDLWKVYVTDFDITKELSKLPRTLSEKEQLFLTGRGIFADYYDIKQMETRLAKYTIRAPFNGTVINALVHKGAIIRTGQKLGEFISTNDFELEVNMEPSQIEYMKEGQSIELTMLDKQFKIIGIVKRINKAIDISTQSVRVYIAVKQNESPITLRSGMYLHGANSGKTYEQTVRIPRQALAGEGKVFVVEGNKAKIANVTTVYKDDETAIVRGLEDNTIVITERKPLLFEGTAVETTTN